MNAAETEYGCWVRIGSYGQSTCELLPEGGCRDCPQFQVKGLGLYDREPPEGYAGEWTRILAEAKPPLEQDATSVLVFRIGQEWLALRTARFEEIIPPRPIHSVPGLRSRAFLGLVNVSGVLLPCMSLVEILGLSEPAAEATPAGSARIAGRMAVVAGQDGRFVLPVDEISGTHRLAPGERFQAPVTVSRTPRHFSCGVFAIRGTVVGVLDEDALFPALTRSITG